MTWLDESHQAQASYHPGRKVAEEKLIRIAGVLASLVLALMTAMAMFLFAVIAVLEVMAWLI